MSIDSLILCLYRHCQTYVTNIARGIHASGPYKVKESYKYIEKLPEDLPPQPPILTTEEIIAAVKGEVASKVMEI